MTDPIFGEMNIIVVIYEEKTHNRDKLDKGKFNRLLNSKQRRELHEINTIVNSLVSYHNQ